jgi:hypothetical protein
MNQPSQIFYLLAFPHNGKIAAPVEKITGLKDAPYFEPVDIDVITIGRESVSVDGVLVTITKQIYDERAQVVECRFGLANPLEGASIQTRKRIQESIQTLIVPAEHRSSGMFEEYVILGIHDITGTPDEYISARAQDLARFIRSQRERFDPEEIDEILASRARYSQHDLTLLDWEGGIIIAPEGDFQSDIELIKIGNYQILRYRMLDKTIDESLQKIADEFRNPKRKRVFGLRRADLQKIVELRMELTLDFEHIDQSLLLIGDWYTAKLYNIIRDEFYLSDWKEVVHSKLDNLEDINSTIQENFSLSWSGFLDQLQIAGWLILLIGYFILFFMDLSAYVK